MDEAQPFINSFHRSLEIIRERYRKREQLLKHREELKRENTEKGSKLESRDRSPIHDGGEYMNPFFNEKAKIPTIRMSLNMPKSAYRTEATPQNFKGSLPLN